MDQRKIQLAFKNTLTGFVPGAFLFMAIVAVGLPALARGSLQVIHNISWKIFVLEQILLACGFALMTLALDPKHLTRARWRNVLAGVGAVILLAGVSAFTQGAGLATIVSASISAGMLSSSTPYFMTRT